MSPYSERFEAARLVFWSPPGQAAAASPISTVQQRPIVTTPDGIQHFVDMNTGGAPLTYMAMLPLIPPQAFGLWSSTAPRIQACTSRMGPFKSS
jgi:hypothetical protein